MILHSTRHTAPPVDFRGALVQGLAPDGGLYLPSTWPTIDGGTLSGWRDLPLSEIAVGVLGHLVGDEFDRGRFDALVRDAFSFPAPTVEVDEGLSVLELFHGPTLAFKDFGARFLARLFGHLLGERGEQATILVATSGDTGSAVAQGFHRVPNVAVVVLYPAGKVSPFQEAQMATLGDNVRALRIPGTFDDCQRLVKTAFVDPDLAPLRLSSANSINIGRLLPQSVYYVASWLAAGGDREDVVFTVPSGNLGNLTAGVIAQRLGMRVRRFVAASNANDVLPEFLRLGVYRARPSVPTISNAMDVGDPSNVARLVELHGGLVETLREHVWGEAVSDEDTRATIRDVHRRTGYVVDPHTAVGVTASRRFRAATGCAGRIVTLATAHPAKFGSVLEEELGFAPALPDTWRDWASRPLRADTLADTRYETFKAALG